MTDQKSDRQDGDGLRDRRSLLALGLHTEAVPPKPAPDAMREALETVRPHIGDWLDSLSRVRLLEQVDFALSSAPMPPADGATEDALTKLLDETWPDGHRAAALSSHLANDMIDIVWQAVQESEVVG